MHASTSLIFIVQILSDLTDFLIFFPWLCDFGAVPGWAHGLLALFQEARPWMPVVL
jgi:hypothetical protein